MTKKELSTVVTEQALEQLRQSYPVELSYTKILLPRLGMYSQDVMEGKGKVAKVVSEAGEFYTDRQTDEEDKEGKKIWEKTELGKEIEGIILYQRKQFRFYAINKKSCGELQKN